MKKSPDRSINFDNKHEQKRNVLLKKHENGKWKNWNWTKTRGAYPNLPRRRHRILLLKLRRQQRPKETLVMSVVSVEKDIEISRRSF